MTKENNETHIAIFNGKSIRRKLVNDKWFFSVVDIIGVLTESLRPRKYWSDLKLKLIEEGSELSAKIGQLKLKSGDGKEYLTDCADTESIFRIIQSIPSKKAEPFKRWLARIGYERIQEIEINKLIENEEYCRKVYKYQMYNYYRMFPSDPKGSLDVFFFMPFRVLMSGGKF